MNTSMVKNFVSNIKFACLLTCLLMVTACRYEPLTITGSVVDESGNALSDVTVWACYSGWGWSEEVGSLVWDKDYCSETTQTNNDGVYVMTFEGPASSRLKAHKEGWVQTQDYIPANSRIVLTSREDYGFRLRAEEKQQSLEHQRHRNEESEEDHYCRVIFPEARSVNLRYHDKALVIKPTFLSPKDKSGSLFAVQGSTRSVNAFSREVTLMMNGEEQESRFTVKKVETNCGPDVHFIEARTPGLNAWPDAKVELLVPSIKAAFDMDMHIYSTHQ